MQSGLNRVLVNAAACMGLLAGSSNGQSVKPIVPMANRLEPKSAKPGTVLVITGAALGKATVEEVFLTDHRFDLQVKVLEQTDQMLKIRIPPFAKAGRLQLLLLMGGPRPAYLEQPVYVLIEEDESAKTDPPKGSGKDGAPQATDKANNHPDKQNQ